MTFKLDSLVNSSGHSYLEPTELAALSQYISSIPERLAVYRVLRDQEVTLMQPIADALKQASQATDSQLEQSLRNGLMVMRHVAMAMLLDDSHFVEERLRGWLPDMVSAHNTQALDQQLFQLLDQQLGRVLNPAQLNLLKPGLTQAQALVMASAVPGI
ncbi:MAG: hypothetical protein HC929_03920 [Leptolyngbyaceae cyanobacterium SM2_5_2]|nr:hypothetical protein [Leptolyngbyaceae cyanobacterium SM2_5_2]